MKVIVDIVDPGETGTEPIRFPFKSKRSISRTSMPSYPTHTSLPVNKTDRSNPEVANEPRAVPVGLNLLMEAPEPPAQTSDKALAAPAEETTKTSETHAVFVHLHEDDNIRNASACFLRTIR